MELVNLTGFERKFPWQLSGGMQQRASIARALAFDADLLLMDEPFGALDEIVRDHLNSELLKLWAATKKTIAFVTHSIPEAVYLSTKIVVMSPRPGRVTDIIDLDPAAPSGRSKSARRRNSSRSPIACARDCAPATPTRRSHERRLAQQACRRSSSVLLALLVVWYVGARSCSTAPWQLDTYQRNGIAGSALAAILLDDLGVRTSRCCRRRTRWRSISGTRPFGPGHHQQAEPRLPCAGSRLSATLLGFRHRHGCSASLLAVLIVHNEATDRSLMPWIIASQTIPILAIAPMLVVVLQCRSGITGLARPRR